MTSPELTREVPPPNAVFWETVRHPKNQELLEGDPTVRTLSKRQLREIRGKIAALQSALNRYFRAYEKHLKQQRRANPDQTPLINAKLDQIKPLMRPAPRRSALTVRNAREARHALALISRLESRITEHKTALSNARLSDRLKREMLREVSYYGQQIIDRWTQLGYREEYFVRNKRFLRRVKIQRAEYTEDSIQFKVLVSRLSLFGSTIPVMPYSVRGWDLVKPETLLELEASCECPVTSPHVDENDKQGFENGVWIEVHRVGMRHGLFEYITLDAVLEKYNQALRKRLAIPVGVKQGRSIEYLYLRDHPHFTYTGITGSGKTNFARVAISTLIQFFSPDEIQLLLVDLKRSGDLNRFSDVPHLAAPIVKEIDDLRFLSDTVVRLMRARMDTLSQHSMFDIDELNAALPDDQRLPHLILMIDECGSINDLASKDDRDRIWRNLRILSAQARAAGIHLGLGTQQPGTRVIPAQVTNNITYSISYRQRTVSGAMMVGGDNRTRNLPAIKGRGWADNGYDLVMIQTPHATDTALKHAIQTAALYPPAARLLLPSQPASDDTAEFLIDVPAPSVPQIGVTEADIVSVALEHGGAMSARRTYDATGGITPRLRINDMIREIAQRGTIDHEGIKYQVRRAGKGYVLIPASKNQGEPIENAIPSTAD